MWGDKRILVSRYQSKWPELIKIYGRLCVYCEANDSNCIDHVIPVSYRRDDTIENLRPACVSCNSIAHSKVFDDFESKKAHILEKRRDKRWQRKQYLCVNCGLPYVYLEQSPSMLMCPECYDIDNETQFAKKIHWIRWIDLLIDAGIDIEMARAQRELGYKVA